MRRRRPLAVVAAGVAIFALLLASCGGSTTSQPTPAANSAAPQTAASDLGAHAVLNAGTPGQGAVAWLLNNVGGGLAGAVAGKGFNEVMVQLGLDQQTNQLNAMAAKLDQIQVQLDQLNKTMETALLEIRKVHQDVLAERVLNVQQRVIGAERKFTEALSNLPADTPEKKSRIATLIDQVGRAVTDPNALEDLWPGSIKDAILKNPALSTTFYRALSDATTGAHPFFTWRDSAALDNVFQYLLTLQALQLNLIVQVKTYQKSSPDSIYKVFWEPYVGDKASFQDYLNGKAPDFLMAATPPGGFLQQQLHTELKRVPIGAVIQRQPQLMWSVDIPNGSRRLNVTPSGPGYPECKVSDQNTRVTCLDDLFGASSSQLTGYLNRAGFGGWSEPSMDQLMGLLAGWSRKEGPPKDWLELQSGSDPKTCKPVLSPGGAQGGLDENSCIWPGETSFTNYWSSSSQRVSTDVAVHGITARESPTVTYDAVGWNYDLLNFNDINSRVYGCSVSTRRLDWSALTKKFPDDRYTVSPDGYKLPYPNRRVGFGIDITPRETCPGGILAPVRQIPPVEQYYFPL